MQLTHYHAKYFAHELTKRCSSDSMEKLAGAVASAQVDLNPHQVDAALFAFNSPLSKGALLAPCFRHRVEAITEAFSTVQEDLDKERKAIMKQWAKRKEQIERVMGATVGMYGDLQGIAGKSLQEIEGLDSVSKRYTIFV